jgi:hypothetical protein
MIVHLGRRSGRLGFSQRVRMHIRGNAVAYVALFFALNAGAYAVTVAPKNSVTSRSIKNGAVKTKDLATGAVKSRKVADDSLTGADVDESSLAQVLTGSDSIPGGDLTGTYAAPQLNAGSVGAGELAQFPAASLKTPIYNPGCTGTNSGFPSDMYLDVQFAAVEYDTSGLANRPSPANDNCFDGLIVPLAGTYVVTASFSWKPSPDGDRKIELRATNPDTTSALHVTTEGPANDSDGGANDTAQSAAGIARLDAGARVYLRGRQTSGTPRNFSHGNLQVAWIGP